MPQKRNQDFTERYPNIKAGTYKPMRDILTKNRFLYTSKTHNDLIFGKEIKMQMVVDTSLLPLKVGYFSKSAVSAIKLIRLVGVCKSMEYLYGDHRSATQTGKSLKPSKTKL